MKKSALVISTVICLCFISCAKKQTRQPDAPDPVQQFFTAFENDLTNTTKIIASNELIKNLTHLQRMDFGGSRFYPLERDALTKMIQSLSSYTYAECFLLNGTGTVIYTMFDDKMFSRNAESFQNSLAILFRHCKEGEPYVMDVSDFPELAGSKRLYFGMPVKRGLNVEGVLIAALNAADVMKYAAIQEEAVDRNGIIRLSRRSEDLLTENAAVKAAAENNPGNDLTAESAGQEYRYRLFSFRNIRWFIRQ